MPQTFKDYGAFIGQPNQDLRIEIFGPGQKNALSFVFSYNEANFGAFTEADFWGRLVVFEGDTLPSVNIPVSGIVGGSDVFATPLRRYLDVVVHTPGPHSFLIPIAQQEGGAQTSSGGTFQAVLTLAQAGPGELFTPRMSVAGQTIVKAV